MEEMEIKTLEEAKMVIAKYDEIISHYENLMKYNKQLNDNLETMNKMLKNELYNNKKIIQKQESIIKKLTTLNEKSQEETAKEETVSNTLCPICQKEHLVRRKSKYGNYYYICPDKECTINNSETERLSYPEVDSKPDTTVEYCPNCGKILQHHESSKTHKLYYHCKECKEYFDDKNGIPVKQKRKFTKENNNEENKNE